MPDTKDGANLLILPLLPRRGIYFSAWQATQEDADRFVRLFRAVWRRLPRDVRHQILALWRPWVDVFAALPPTDPARFVAAELSLRFRGHSRRVIATTGGAFREMRFSLQYFIGEAGWFSAATIAHELAHVYQFATGYSMTSRSRVEADARRLQKEWGFWFGPRGRHASVQHAKKAIAAANEVAPKDAAVLSALLQLHSKKGGA